MKEYKNPVPTVDIIIHVNGSRKTVVLIKRKNPPYGWALPGGFVDYGETLENAAVREAKEETNLTVELISQFHTYSDPSRDTRLHTITTVYSAEAEGFPEGMDDAEEAKIFDIDNLPDEMAFDHKEIIDEYKKSKE
jgi:ADP-ribose pyrophosphatase YjhB (NUDIX family)